MKKALIILIFLVSPIFTYTQNKKYPKNYVSIGFLDHKTGTSLIGYTRTLQKYDENEFFIGAGTLIAANTLSTGWKSYFLDKHIDMLVSVYSVMSIQAVAGMGGGFVSPAISIGIEKELVKEIFINLGVNSTIRIYNNNIKLITFPNININLRSNFRDNSTI